MYEYVRTYLCLAEGGRKLVLRYLHLHLTKEENKAHTDRSISEHSPLPFVSPATVLDAEWYPSLSWRKASTPYSDSSYRKGHPQLELFQR